MEIVRWWYNADASTETRQRLSRLKNWWGAVSWTGLPTLRPTGQPVDNGIDPPLEENEVVKLSGKRMTLRSRLTSMVHRTLFDHTDKPVRDFHVVVSTVIWLWTKVLTHRSWKLQKNYWTCSLIYLSRNYRS